MIATLLVAAVAGLAGLATGRALGWPRRGPQARRMARSRPPVALTAPADRRLRGLPCALGDVVLNAQGEEAWLAGALILREHVPDADEGHDSERTALAVFLAPDPGGARAVLARASPDPSLEWLWPVDATSLALGSEPPSVVEIEGGRFERVRRLPLRADGVGTGVPPVGPSAIVGEYEGGAGTTLLVVIGEQATLAWRGRRLEPGMFEVLPGSTTGRPTDGTD